VATVRASKGQAAKLPLTVQFSDATGAALDPTGTPTVTVFYVDPAGSLVSKAVLNASKQGGLTGFYGTFLDVSNFTTYPAGDYVVRWSGVVSAITTAGVDFFEIDEAPSASAGTVVTGAYCTEAQVRDWAQPLENLDAITSPKAVQKIAYAANVIDGKLRASYTVPFSGPPYDTVIVMLNIWLAGAYLLEDRQAQMGNTNTLGATLSERVDEWIADILSGAVALSVAPRTDSPTGVDMSQSSTLDSTDTPEPLTFGWNDPNSSLSRY